MATIDDYAVVEDLVSRGIEVSVPANIPKTVDAVRKLIDNSPVQSP